MDLDFATVFKKSGPWQYNHDQSRVCADEEQALPRLLRLSVLRFSQTHPFFNTLHKQPFRPSPPPPHPPPSLDGREGIAASRAFKEGEDHSGSGSSSPYQIDGEKATKIKRSSGECVSHHPPHPRPPHHTARNNRCTPYHFGHRWGEVVVFLVAVIVDRVDDKVRRRPQRGLNQIEAEHPETPPPHRRKMQSNAF